MSASPAQTVAVFGALRSGTTLLRLMLDQNDRLACPGETDYLFDHTTGGTPGNPTFNSAEMAADRMYQAFCNNFSVDPEAPQTMQSLLDTMRSQKTDAQAVVVLMLHRHLDTALTHLPDGVKIVHLVRDPRDVARSSIGMGWAGSTYYGVRHWLRTEHEWAACAPRLNPEQVLQVQYETLIETPEKTLANICAFFGVTYDPAMLDYDNSSTYSKPDPSLTYQWRTKQTPQEVGLVEGQLGSLLADLGYAPSGHPAIVPGPLQKLQLTIGHRWARWSVSIERFGWRDPIMAMLARRLRWPALGRAAQRRMDAVTTQRIK